MPKTDVVTVITRDGVRTLRARTSSSEEKSGMTRGGASSGPSNAVVMKASDFLRAHRQAEFTESIDEKNRLKRQVEATEAARKRREKMSEFDRIRRMKGDEDGEEDAEEKRRKNSVLAAADRQREEDEDAVKRMNELSLRAKCVAIRDAQVLEKRRIAEKTRREELRLDAMMEQERQRALERASREEKSRGEMLRTGAAVIRSQISENAEARQVEAEMRDRETRATLQLIREQQEADARRIAEQRQAQRQLMEEVHAANAEASARKQAQRLADAEEDRQVMQYLVDREAKFLEADRQAAAKRAERERELARLRAAQERATDRQAALDALRARRAHEQLERESRRKEKETAERKARQERELREERHRQQQARELAIANEALLIKREFSKQVAKQQEELQKSLEEEARLHRSNREYSEQIKSQIRERETLRYKEREDRFLEGHKLAKERGERQHRLERVKDRKIKDLVELGVPEQYIQSVKRTMAQELKQFL